jgi:hypothetical protein
MAQDEGKKPRGGAIAKSNPSGDRTAEIDLYEKGDISKMMDRAGSGRLQPMRGFDEDYTDIVDYIVRCTHRIWDEGGVGLLTKVLAIELAPHGITVNTVAPTFVDTDLTRTTLEDPAWRERVLSRIPLGHVAEVEDVAAAVLYLASPAARMVTGHSLLVDGGWTAW